MTIALVTGANRGIGLEVVRQLAQQADMTVLLTGRSLEKAEAAAAQLQTDGITNVVAKALDVAKDDSVQRLAAAVEADYGVLDILINNAGMFVDWTQVASTADLGEVRTLFETNVFGPWRMVQAFLPLLKKSEHPRIVNVSSGAGSHGEPYFGLTTNNGGSASYGISKAALNALTVKLAAELADTKIIVNAAGPGLTATAPGMEDMGARPISDGAASIVWAALLPDDGPRGGFFRDGEPLPW